MIKKLFVQKVKFEKVFCKEFFFKNNKKNINISR